MSSYIRLEILLFFRAFETGVGMLVVYRLTDMLKRRLWCNRRGRRFEKVKKEKK